MKLKPKPKQSRKNDKTIKVTAPKPQAQSKPLFASWDVGAEPDAPITNQKLRDMVNLWDAEIAAEEEATFSKKIMGDYADMTGDLVNLAEKYERVMEQYTDALAIIRYLENKLFVLIQNSDS